MFKGVDKKDVICCSEYDKYLFVVELACCYTVYLKYIRTVLLFGSWKEKIGSNLIQDC